jgi:hypothetical protein
LKAVDERHKKANLKTAVERYKQARRANILIAGTRCPCIESKGWIDSRLKKPESVLTQPPRCKCKQEGYSEASQAVFAPHGVYLFVRRKFVTSGSPLRLSRWLIVLPVRA